MSRLRLKPGCLLMGRVVVSWNRFALVPFLSFRHVGSWLATRHVSQAEQGYAVLLAQMFD